MNRISIICLGVRDIVKSMEFYKNLGFKTYETDDRPPVVFFDNQGSKLELFPLEELAKDINQAAPPALSLHGFGGFTLACNFKSEQEVDDFLLKAEQCGGLVVKKAQKVFWGGYSGYFQDPDGYYWEAAYAPGLELDEHDMPVIKSGS